MRLAILGAGDVGRSVADLASEYGHEVVALADSSSATVDSSGIDVDSALEAKLSGGQVGEDDPETVFDTDYDVLVEATPTTLDDAEPGFSHVKRALEADRHVVLANKGPVAERYEELRALEADSAGSIRFEATVGGAIPVLSTIEDSTPQAVTAVRGVLNGTANFILTRMAAEGWITNTSSRRPRISASRKPIRPSTSTAPTPHSSSLSSRTFFRRAVSHSRMPRSTASRTSPAAHSTSRPKTVRQSDSSARQPARASASGRVWFQKIVPSL